VLWYTFALRKVTSAEYIEHAVEVVSYIVKTHMFVSESHAVRFA
jgi:hypothetical protein